MSKKDDENNEPHFSDRVQFNGEVPDKSDVLPLTKLGGGLELLIDKKVNFDHAAAEKVLNLAEFKIKGEYVDRPLRDRWVEHLTKEMMADTFRPEIAHISSCICEEANGDFPAGTEYRMNSQHVSWARLNMPANWPCQMRWLKYRAQTLDAMRRLYASEDRGAPRTKANVINSYLAGTDVVSGLGQKALRALASGFAMWQWEAYDVQRTHSADEISYLMRTAFRLQITRVRDYLLSCNKSRRMERMFYRGPIMAALITTLDKLPGSAHQFWDVIRDGIGEGVTSTKDPRVRLHNQLLDTTLIGAGTRGSTGMAQTSGRRFADSETVLRWCLTAWNYWRGGLELSSFHTPGSRPKVK